jgi:hypothetical protein
MSAALGDALSRPPSSASLARPGAGAGGGGAAGMSTHRRCLVRVLTAVMPIAVGLDTVVMADRRALVAVRTTHRLWEGVRRAQRLHLAAALETDADRLKDTVALVRPGLAPRTASRMASAVPTPLSSPAPWDSAREAAGPGFFLSPLQGPAVVSGAPPAATAQLLAQLPASASAAGGGNSTSSSGMGAGSTAAAPGGTPATTTNTTTGFRWRAANLTASMTQAFGGTSAGSSGGGGGGGKRPMSLALGGLGRNIAGGGNLGGSATPGPGLGPNSTTPSPAATVAAGPGPGRGGGGVVLAAPLARRPTGRLEPSGGAQLRAFLLESDGGAGGGNDVAAGETPLWETDASLKAEVLDEGPYLLLHRLLVPAPLCLQRRVGGEQRRRRWCGCARCSCG